MMEKIVLAAGVAAVVSLAYTGNLGGKIRHTEILGATAGGAGMPGAGADGGEMTGEGGKGEEEGEEGEEGDDGDDENE
jgi:hypothetical protein